MAILFADVEEIRQKLEQCVGYKQFGDAVITELENGQIVMVLQSLDEDKPDPLDAIWHYAFSVSIYIPIAEKQKLRIDLVNELFRRPKLAKKLYHAMLSEQSPSVLGSFLHSCPPLFSAVEFALEDGQEKTRSALESLSRKLYEKPSKIEHEERWRQNEIFRFFVWWEATGRPIDLTGLRPGNFLVYYDELSQWWLKNQASLVFDEKTLYLRKGTAEEIENGRKKIPPAPKDPPPRGSVADILTFHTDSYALLGTDHLFIPTQELPDHYFFLRLPLDHPRVEKWLTEKSAAKKANEQTNKQNAPEQPKN